MANEKDSYATREQLEAHYNEGTMRYLAEIVDKHREAAETPNWAEFDNAFKHVHDWRTYVTASVRSAWALIALEGRCALIDCCQEAADREHWD